MTQTIAVIVEGHAGYEDEVERRKGGREGGREGGLRDAPFGDWEGAHVFGRRKGKHDHIARSRACDLGGGREGGREGSKEEGKHLSVDMAGRENFSGSTFYLP